MKKILTKIFFLILIILILFIVEGLIIYAFFVFTQSIFNFTLIYSNFWRDIFGLIWFRILFGMIPQVILYYIGARYAISKGILGLSIFNVCVFIINAIIVLAIIESDIDGLLDAIKAHFLEFKIIYCFVVAVFLSPLILNKFTFFRKLIRMV